MARRARRRPVLEPRRRPVLEPRGAPEQGRDFATFGDFLAAARQPGVDNGLSSTVHRMKNDPEFYGVSTMDEAYALAENGWPAGVEQIVAGLDIAARSAMGVTFSQGLDVAGERPSIPDYLAGVPDHMVAAVPHWAAQARVVKIVINRAASSGIEGKAMIARGIALLSIVDELEIKGRSCEIWVVFHNEHQSHTDTMIHRIKVKEAGERMELDRMAFVLAHPAFHRALKFRLMEQEPIGFPSYGTRKEGDYPDAVYIPHIDPDDTNDIPAALTKMRGYFKSELEN